MWGLQLESKGLFSFVSTVWIHDGCAGVKRVTPKFSRNFTCRKCEGNIGEAVEQEVRLCDEVKTLRE